MGHFKVLFLSWKKSAAVRAEPDPLAAEAGPVVCVEEAVDDDGAAAVAGLAARPAESALGFFWLKKD